MKEAKRRALGDRGSCYPPASLSSSAMASFPGFPSDSVGKLMQLGLAKLSLLSHFSTPSCLLGALVSRSSTSRLPCRYLFPLAAPESPSSHRQSPLGGHRVCPVIICLCWGLWRVCLAISSTIRSTSCGSHTTISTTTRSTAWG